MKQFEYKQRILESPWANINPSDMMKTLNDEGSLGWEAVSVKTFGDLNGGKEGLYIGYIILLKREITK
jgi:hypothetical protein